MIKQGAVILVVVAVSCFAYCQDRNGSTIRESTQAHCELNQDDYAVFAALLKGLHGPEDPEEAWEGKEMLILDVTATPQSRKSKQVAGDFVPNPMLHPPKRHSRTMQRRRTMCVRSSPNSAIHSPTRSFQKGRQMPSSARTVTGGRGSIRRTRKVRGIGNCPVRAKTPPVTRHYYMLGTLVDGSVVLAISTCCQNRMAIGWLRIA
jgi:hypothetical protein